MFGQIDNNYISVGLTTKVNKGSSSRNKNKNSNLTLWNQIMTHILEGKELFQTEEITQQVLKMELWMKKIINLLDTILIKQLVNIKKSSALPNQLRLAEITNVISSLLYAYFIIFIF